MTRNQRSQFVVTMIGLLAMLIAVDVLSDLPKWRVCVGGWMLYLAVQGAVYVMLLHMDKSDKP